ncbi:MAG: ATP-dependent nuclease, subunit A [Candidatus Jettenia ecosi]|uniref:DNA 3'-5' helicase n=1 Tax=Candidatus Jettenia ecosi TaxID=2494326 RepID=A0A533Q6T1_9BACT|nr:MAG: ATP-dependent nuclease, subunit A [Candidatus Jettenia ecosi]
MQKPIDDATRKLAVFEQERNIVVTAGAGTGKTTLLVNRILHVLLGHKKLQTEESPIQKVVAMTFTEKAASDIKMRLLGELEKIVAVIKGNASEDEKMKGEAFLAHIRDTYQVTYREIERRARKSLEDMDKAIIGTIHSFAAYILRLYPVESGVAPGFVVDEGDVFDELFDKEWTQWLDTELTLVSPHAHVWKYVLKQLDLGSLKELAKRLSGFTIPFNSLMSSPDDEWRHTILDPLRNEIGKIIPSCEKPKNNLLSQLQELLKILDTIEKQGIRYLNNLEYDLDKKASEAKAGWTNGGFETAQALVKESHNLLKKLKTVDNEFIKVILDLIIPFAKAFRQTYISQGYVSFDGLLTLTRDLLRNSEYRFIRDRLKSEFRAILVDEFQDTDPVQYEIVLFLSEASGHYSEEACEAVPEPGKLFIVGDPKQSIYSFRRADIEAYEQVVKQICGPNEVLKLQENFRSHSGIIDVINQLFDGRIIIERPGLQPCYIPIHANRPKVHPSQTVEIILVSDNEGKEMKADESREAEAEWIARWIIKQVNNEDIRDELAENRLRKFRYKDVALLLRAFTQVRPYIEAFKRYGIPYLVEGEKYFYTTQEILDFMNLLRIIENPYDTIALAGVLRSPMVGLTDREIYELRIHNLFDYRKDISDKILNGHGSIQRDENNSFPVFLEEDKGNFLSFSKEGQGSSPPFLKGDQGGLKEIDKTLNQPDFIPIVKEFYNLLRKFHAHAGILPVSQLIDEIMDNTHIAEITASAWHGEQKLANLRKLYQMACDQEQSDAISLKTFINRITRRIKEAKEEGESPLADETLDVVKILTIHKSKGLEFPIVILGNLHGEVRNDNEVLGPAVFDWSTSTTGIVIGRGVRQVRNLHSILIEKKLNDRSWEEEKRILYVAMTRAKERLVLTGLLKYDDKSYMGLITQSLKESAGIEFDNEIVTSTSSLPADSENSPSSPSTKTPEIPFFEKTSNSPPFLKGDQGGLKNNSSRRKKISLGNAEIFAEHFKFDGIRRPSKTQKGKKWNTDWASWVEIWRKRKQAMDEIKQTPIFISPTSLSAEGISHQESPPTLSGGVGKIAEDRLNLAMLIGSMCHYVLERWDFRGMREELCRLIESAMGWVFTTQNEDAGVMSTTPIHTSTSVPEEGSSKVYINPSFFSSPEIYEGTVTKSLYTIQARDLGFIKAETFKILLDFIDSEAYRELQSAEILGREVPFLLQWNGQIMRGKIDILYKIDNRIIIAEYKTDTMKTTNLSFAEAASFAGNSEKNVRTGDQFTEKLGKYRHQKEVYTKAVKRCLNRDNPEFKFIFLRSGKAISV